MSLEKMAICEILLLPVSNIQIHVRCTCTRAQQKKLVKNKVQKSTLDARARDHSKKVSNK